MTSNNDEKGFNQGDKLQIAENIEISLEIAVFIGTIGLKLKTMIDTIPIM